MDRKAGYLIAQIGKLTNHKVNEILKREKITEFNGAQGTIMYVLFDRKQMTIKEIGKATGLAKTSLTSMLERMEQQGLIEKEDNLDDRRSTLIRLTGKARRQKKNIDKVSKGVNDLYYRGLKESEISRFEKTLEKIVANLEEDGKD